MNQCEICIEPGIKLPNGRTLCPIHVLSTAKMRRRFAQISHPDIQNTVGDIHKQLAHINRAIENTAPVAAVDSISTDVSSHGGQIDDHHARIDDHDQKITMIGDVLEVLRVAISNVSKTEDTIILTNKELTDEIKQLKEYCTRSTAEQSISTGIAASQFQLFLDTHKTIWQRLLWLLLGR